MSAVRSSLPIFNPKLTGPSMTPPRDLFGHEASSLDDPTSNMQRMLIGEKTRAEKHRVNFEALKLQTDKLSADHKSLSLELMNKNAEMNQMKEQFQSIIASLERELKQKSKIVSTLEQQSFTPKKLEEIKLQIVTDLQKTFRQKMADLEAETDQYRNNFNKLRHEHVFLKTQFDKRGEYFSRDIQTLRMKFDSEKNELLAAKKQLIVQQNEERQLAEQKIKTVVKECAHLKEKLKLQEDIAENLQGQLEKVSVDNDTQIKTLMKTVTDLKVQIKQLQVLKTNNENEIEYLKRENKNAETSLGEKVLLLAERDRELRNLANEIEMLKRDWTTKDNDCQLLAAKFNNFESDKCCKLQNEIDDVITEKELLEMQLEKVKKSLTLRENELMKKMEKLKESHSLEVSQLTEQKATLDSQIITITSDLKTVQEKASALHTENTSKDHEIDKLNEAKTALSSDIESLESTVKQLKGELNEKNTMLESKSKEISDFVEKIMNLQSQLESAEVVQNNLQAQNNLQSQKVAEVQSEMGKVRQTEQTKYQETLREWFSTKTELTRKVDDLTRENSNLNKKLATAGKVHLAVKTNLRKKIDLYKEKLAESLSKISFLEHNLEKQAGVPVETHNKLKRDYKTLVKKMEMFRDVIQSQNSYEHETHVNDLLTNLASVDTFNWYPNARPVSNDLIGHDLLANGVIGHDETQYAWNTINRVSLRQKELSQDQLNVMALYRGESQLKDVNNLIPTEREMMTDSVGNEEDQSDDEKEEKVVEVSFENQHADYAEEFSGVEDDNDDVEKVEEVELDESESLDASPSN